MKTIYIRKSSIKLVIGILIVLIVDMSFVYINSCTTNYSEYELDLVNKYNEKKLLVLTFDDGPSKYTSKLLKVLKDEDVKATFFVLGENIAGKEDVLLQEKNDGHLIGIHSYKHVFFTKISKEKIIEQITTTKNMIYDITDFSPTYIRVPYGIINDNVKSILKEENLENILWNVDSLDWSYKDTQKTVKHIINTTNGNDIILMHDIYDTSVEAAKQIIKYYKENGYTFVTIAEFYRVKEISKSI